VGLVTRAWHLANAVCEATMNEKTDFCSPAEITKLLGISRSTFWRWRDLPGFPRPMKIGLRKMHFSLGEVKKFLSDTEVLSVERKAADSLATDGVPVGLRDYFAAKAMQALIEGALASDSDFPQRENVSGRAYAYADAMLTARSA
jgi:predicted DNA-binding transcriptional regulator AlpA